MVLFVGKKIVVVTHSSGQGIGKRCAQLFAKEGSKVVVTDIDAGMFLFLSN